jgi:hypothetical protein
LPSTAYGQKGNETRKVGNSIHADVIAPPLFSAGLKFTWLSFFLPEELTEVDSSVS